MNVELLSMIENSSTTSTKYKSDSKNSATSEYAKILASKMSNARNEMREMNYIQSQLDEIRELQEEITGELQNQKTSGNAAAGDSSGKGAVEKVTKFLADGSVMVIRVQDGDVVDKVKFKPHYVPIPDYSAPPDPSGNVSMKLEARQNLDWLAMLVM